VKRFLILASLAMISTSACGMIADESVKETEKTYRQVERGLSFEKAIRSGNIDYVKYFVELGVDIDKENEYGNSPLTLACRCGHEDIVKYLIERGADINRECKEKDLLNIPQEDIDEDVVKYLMKYAEDINRENNEIQLSVPHEKIVEYMVSKFGVAEINTGEEESQLIIPYKNGEKHLIAHIPNYNLGFCGGSPLHIACGNGNESIIKYLIEHGANINGEDEWGETPLHHACENGHENIVEYLIEHGADFNKENEWGETPLHLAYISGCERIISLLTGNETVCEDSDTESDIDSYS